jgi:hypothetical protein
VKDVARTEAELEAAIKLISALTQFTRSIREMDLELACRGLSARDKERLFQVTFPEVDKIITKIGGEIIFQTTQAKLRSGVDSKIINREIAAMLGPDDGEVPETKKSGRGQPG